MGRPKGRKNVNHSKEEKLALLLRNLSGVVLCQDNGHIKPLLFGKISKMHKVVAFIPRFA